MKIATTWRKIFISYGKAALLSGLMGFIVALLGLYTDPVGDVLRAWKVMP